MKEFLKKSILALGAAATIALTACSGANGTLPNTTSATVPQASQQVPIPGPASVASAPTSAAKSTAQQPPMQTDCVALRGRVHVNGAHMRTACAGPTEPPTCGNCIVSTGGQGPPPGFGNICGTSCDPVLPCSGTCGPPHGGGPVSLGALFPAAAQLANYLTSKGVPSGAVSQSLANNAVEAFYNNGPIQDAFTGEAAEFSWSAAANTALNGATAPSLSEAASITGNTLVRFSTTAAGSANGPWWTTVSSLANGSGGIMTPAEIQEAFALPNVPTYVSVGGNFANGSSVFIGEAAENAFGNGGGLQIFGASATAGEASTAEISSGLATLGEVLAALAIMDHHATPNHAIVKR